MALLEVRGLEKWYGRRQVVKAARAARRAAEAAARRPAVR